jgi:nitroreductase
LTSDISIEHSSLKLLLTRASALKFAEPGPSREQIDSMLKAAVTAADHGRIRPWRFVVMQGEGRKRLGDLLAKVQAAIKPDTSEDTLEKTREKALRAPLVIAVVCQADSSHDVPVLEQQFATAAAGAQLMLAARALGFGSNWKTGTPAYHPIMREGLGFGAQDAIIGFFYIGSEPKASPLPRASTEAVVQFWNERQPT